MKLDWVDALDSSRSFVRDSEHGKFALRADWRIDSMKVLFINETNLSKFFEQETQTLHPTAAFVFRNFHVK